MISRVTLTCESTNKVMLVGICNPDALNVRICNPKIA